MRTPTFTILLGTNGTGKTTLLRLLIGKNEALNRRVLIVTPDDIEWQGVEEISKPSEIYNFEGVRKILFMPGTLQAIYDNYFNGLLVLDDYKAFGIKSNDDITTMRQIAIRRRQRMLDIAVAAHGFTEVVPFFLYTFSTHVVLFRTLDNIKRVSAVLKDFDKMKNLQMQVNKQAETEPHFYKIVKQ